MKQFIREYRPELIAALMALLGIFLLVEQMDIRVTIFRIMRLVWRTVGETVAGSILLSSLNGSGGCGCGSSSE